MTSRGLEVTSKGLEVTSRVAEVTLRVLEDSEDAMSKNEVNDAIDGVAEVDQLPTDFQQLTR